MFDDDDRAELLNSTRDMGDITYGWGWQAGVEAVTISGMGKNDASRGTQNFVRTGPRLLHR